MYGSNLQLKNNLSFLQVKLVITCIWWWFVSNFLVPIYLFFNFPFCLMFKAFSEKVNFMLMLSLIFSIERDEIHGD